MFFILGIRVTTCTISFPCCRVLLKQGEYNHELDPVIAFPAMWEFLIKVRLYLLGNEHPLAYEY